MTSDQNLEQNYALIARGVQRFPKHESKSASTCEGILFLLDFPSSEDTIVQWPDGKFADDSQLSLLQNLASKLGCLERVSIAFLENSFPKKGLENSNEKRNSAVIEKTVSERNPCSIVCFGWRTAYAIQNLVSEAQLIGAECCDFGHIAICGAQRRVIVAPGARELVLFPEWRSRVWQVFQAALT